MNPIADVHVVVERDGGYWIKKPPADLFGNPENHLIHLKIIEEHIGGCASCQEKLLALLVYFLLDNFCLPHRHAISDLHRYYRLRSEKNTTYKLAIEHVQGCSACKRWFQDNLCPQMQSLYINGGLNKDVCTLHRMLHGEEIFDTADCLSNLCMGSAH